MDIIVDAYNLLRLEIADEKISQSQRKHFINLLRSYGEQKKHTMIVVFDGGEYRWPVQETHKGIIVKYAGTHHTADEVIIAYIKRNLGRNMLLVSSDKQLRDEAAYHGVELIHARDFYDLLHIRSSSQSLKEDYHTTIIKTAVDTDNEVDKLMERIMRMQIKPDDVIPLDERKPQAQQLSRKERKRLQKLKKL